MSASEEDNRPFDKFELCAALLLGLGAIGAALAGFEANQWGSKQMEAYGLSNQKMTEAAREYNEATSYLNADFAAVAMAKAQIIEARESGGSGADMHLEIAENALTTQLTELAYRTLNLPMEFYVEDLDNPSAPAAPAPEAPAPATADEETAEDEDAEPASPALAAAAAGDRDMPRQELYDLLQEELDEDYTDSMLAKGEQMAAEAKAQFEEGNKCDNIGDMFDLAGIAFTMALFFAGLSLVFKTRMRWYLWGAGAVITVISFIFMLFQPWTM